MKFEYHREPLPNVTSLREGSGPQPSVLDRLNELGAQGWELVSVTVPNNVHVFKRPLAAMQPVNRVEPAPSASDGGDNKQQAEKGDDGLENRKHHRRKAKRRGKKAKHPKNDHDHESQHEKVNQ